MLNKIPIFGKLFGKKDVFTAYGLYREHDNFFSVERLRQDADKNIKLSGDDKQMWNLGNIQPAILKSAKGNVPFFYMEKGNSHVTALPKIPKSSGMTPTLYNSAINSRMYSVKLGGSGGGIDMSMMQKFVFVAIGFVLGIVAQGFMKPAGV